MNLWYVLAKLLSLHRDYRALTQGPSAYARRQLRKSMYRASGREINRYTRQRRHR